MRFFSFDLTGLTSENEWRGRSEDSRSLFALRRFIYYTLQYQLICMVCRLRPWSDSPPSLHRRTDVITEGDAFRGFSTNRDVMKRNQITDTVLRGRRARRRLMRRGRPQRFEPVKSDLSQNGPAPGPLAPGPRLRRRTPTSTENQQTLGMECLERRSVENVHSGWGAVNIHRDLVCSCNGSILVQQFGAAEQWLDTDFCILEWN